MTNFRIITYKDQAGLFKYCITCGASLEEESYNDGSIALVCSRNWVHLSVDLSDDEDQATIMK